MIADCMDWWSTSVGGAGGGGLGERLDYDSYQSDRIGCQCSNSRRERNVQKRVAKGQVVGVLMLRQQGVFSEKILSGCDCRDGR